VEPLRRLCRTLLWNSLRQDACTTALGIPGEGNGSCDVLRITPKTRKCQRRVFQRVAKGLDLRMVVGPGFFQAVRKNFDRLRRVLSNQ
jgi:hypothetical protein